MNPFLVLAVIDDREVTCTDCFHWSAKGRTESCYVQPNILERRADDLACDFFMPDRPTDMERNVLLSLMNPVFGPDPRPQDD